MTDYKFKLFRNTKIAVLFSLFYLTGCVANENHTQLVDSSALQANPGTILLGDSVLLKFPQKHPKNLSIQSPNGTWYSIHNTDNEISIISPEKYSHANELDLKTGELEGITWKNGIKMKQIVFKEHGKYLIYMADNMETEPENTFHFMQHILLHK